MNTSTPTATRQQGLPVLLFDDECAVCRAIARWVVRAAHDAAHAPTLIVRPIGEDPKALRALNPALDIWQAYATIHLLMADGTMKQGGLAVAEVLRRCPATAWFSGLFALRILGVQPFQRLLDGAYALLSDVRPALGCASCGQPAPWVRPIAWVVAGFRRLFGRSRKAQPLPHFSVRGSATRLSTTRSPIHDLPR